MLDTSEDGFLGLEPGFTRITGCVEATGARIGEAGFVVHKGAVPYPRMLPAPQGRNG